MAACESPVLLDNPTPGPRHRISLPTQEIPPKWHAAQCTCCEGYGAQSTVQGAFGREKETRVCMVTQREGRDTCGPRELTFVVEVYATAFHPRASPQPQG